jgi:tetratricopeptide (TPR) repeat protein
LTMRLLLNDNKLYPFMLDEKKTNITDLSDAMLAFLEGDLRKFSIRRDVQSIDNAVDKFWTLVEKIEDVKRFPLFIFDNLEAFQVDAGGHFQDKHGDLSELINNIIARGFPVILTSRYPVPDFPAVQAVNLNEVAFGDFYRKAQTLKFFELRHRIGVGEEEVQRRLGQGGSDKANFKQVLSVLHTTLGGNYRALEFFDNIYQTDSRSAYDTLEELAAFSQQMANDSVKVRERLQSEAKSLVFDKLIKLLTPDELRTLQLLEPFRVPVLPEAVEMQDPSVKSLKNNLKRLFDLTLIEQHEIGDDKVEAYYVAPLVRDFLQEAKLIALDFSHKRAGDYFDKRIKTTKNVDDAEEAYFHYYTAKDKDQVNEYGNGLCQHYFKNQIFHKAYDVGKQTEDFVGEDIDGFILNNLGQVLTFFGQLDAALPYFERNLIRDRAIGNQSGEAQTLNNISLIYSAKGDDNTAIYYLEQSLVIRRSIGDRSGESESLCNLGTTALAKGEYDTALRYLEQSNTIRQEIGDLKGEGTVLNNISQIYKARYDYDTALSYLEQSLVITKEISNISAEGPILNNISQIYFAKGDYDTALHYLGQALKIVQEIGDRKSEGSTLNNISQIHSANEDYNTALRYLGQSLIIQQQIGNRKGEAQTLNNIGQIYAAQKEHKIALRYLEQSLVIQQQIGDRKTEHVTLHNLGIMSYESINYDIALSYWKQSLAISQDIGDLADSAMTLTNIGGLFWEQKQEAALAIACFMQAYLILTQIGSPDARIPESWLYGINDAIGEDAFKAIVSEQGGVEQ